jgi:hypothetical protein
VHFSSAAINDLLIDAAHRIASALNQISICLREIPCLDLGAGTYSELHMVITDATKNAARRLRQQLPDPG